MGRRKTAYQRESDAKNQQRQYQNNLNAIKTNQRNLQDTSRRNKESADRLHKQTMEKLRNNNNKSDLERLLKNQKQETDRKINEMKRSCERNLKTERSKLRGEIDQFKQEKRHLRNKQQNEFQKV